MEILNFDQIIESLEVEHAYALQKEAFKAFAEGRLIQPPIAHLELPHGSLHIKYGMIQGDSQFVVKHATGFSGNWQQGLPTGDGFLAAFCASTGMLKAILLDQGYLTDLRTALAVRICAELFAPRRVEAVGVVGTGVQARLSIEQQAKETGCKNIHVWGRTSERVQQYKGDMEGKGFNVTVAPSPEWLLKETDMIVTTTSSKTPILYSIPNMRAKLLIAVGADEVGKQEIDSSLTSSFDRIIGDHPVQCLRVGELQHSAVTEGQISSLGNCLKEPTLVEPGPCFVDLTGLAVQDIQMVKAVLGARE